VLSLAGYAISSYLLQAKDRHNGNVMIDNKGAQHCAASFSHPFFTAAGSPTRWHAREA
jgi:hypothetical protein